MSRKTKPEIEIKKPEDLDWKETREVMKKVIQDNREWLKEMANK